MQTQLQDSGGNPVANTVIELPTAPSGATTEPTPTPVPTGPPASPVPAAPAGAPAPRGKAKVNGDVVAFWCPACNRPHAVPFVRTSQTTPQAWYFDGDVNNPTIQPSLRVFGLDGTTTACHVVVTKGVLNYCTDMPGPFAGKAVPMVDWPNQLE